MKLKTKFMLNIVSNFFECSFTPCNLLSWVVVVLCAYESQRHFAFRRHQRPFLVLAAPSLVLLELFQATAAFVLMQQTSLPSRPVSYPSPATNLPRQTQQPTHGQHRRPLANHLGKLQSKTWRKMKIKMEYKFEKLKKKK